MVRGRPRPGSSPPAHSSRSSGSPSASCPVFVLLGALMVYDYIAVYRTKHMLSLADVVIDMKLPILLVMPSEPATTTRTRRP